MRNTQIPTKLEPWDDKALRRISVNNFGYGGTNAHLILDSLSTYQKELDDSSISTNGRDHDGYLNSELNGPQHDKSLSNGATKTTAQLANGKNRKPSQSETFPHVIVLTAKSEKSLVRTLDNLRQWISRNSDLGDEAFRNLAYTLSTRRSIFRWRCSFTGTSFKDVLSKLSSKSLSPTRSVNRIHNIFVFTGQGAQWYVRPILTRRSQAN